MAHDLKLDGTDGSAMLDPGASETVSLGVISEDAEAWCTVPGHREAGMELGIVVTGGSGTAATGDDGGADVASAPAADITIDDISRSAALTPAWPPGSRRACPRNLGRPRSRRTIPARARAEGQHR
ncbi:MAG: hypothetical protein U5K30_06945 [Acidimicrobiales bacterium]|nr:hypothetical protein [Acidimicrobiales bacterium]